MPLTHYAKTRLTASQLAVMMSSLFPTQQPLSRGTKVTNGGLRRDDMKASGTATIVLVVLLQLGTSPAEAQNGVAESTPGAQPQPPAGTAPAGNQQAAASPPAKENGADSNTAKESKWTAASLKEGRLVRYGLTGGAATMLEFGLDAGGLGHSVMPYVVILPGWWFVHGAQTKTYCATRWVGDDAAQAANDEAKAAALKMKKAKATAAGTNADDVKDVSAAEIFALTGWDTLKVGKCYLTYLPGFFLGVPAKFNATWDETDKATDFSPQLSFGLAWAPISYASLLGGFTVSNVTAADGSNKREWTFTLGIGGNLDLLAMLFDLGS